MTSSLSAILESSFSSARGANGETFVSSLTICSVFNPTFAAISWLGVSQPYASKSSNTRLILKDLKT